MKKVYLTLMAGASLVAVDAHAAFGDVDNGRVNRGLKSAAQVLRAQPKQVKLAEDTNPLDKGKALFHPDWIPTSLGKLGTKLKGKTIPKQSDIDRLRKTYTKCFSQDPHKETKSFESLLKNNNVGGIIPKQVGIVTYSQMILPVLYHIHANENVDLGNILKVLQKEMLEKGKKIFEGKKITQSRNILVSYLFEEVDKLKNPDVGEEQSQDTSDSGSFLSRLNLFKYFQRVKRKPSTPEVPKALASPSRLGNYSDTPPPSPTQKNLTAPENGPEMQKREDTPRPTPYQQKMVLDLSLKKITEESEGQDAPQPKLPNSPTGESETKKVPSPTPGTPDSESESKKGDTVHRETTKMTSPSNPLPKDWTWQGYLKMNPGLANLFTREPNAGKIKAAKSDDAKNAIKKKILMDHFLNWGRKLKYKLEGTSRSEGLPKDWTWQGYLKKNPGLANLFTREANAGRIKAAKSDDAKNAIKKKILMDHFLNWGHKAGREY